MGKSGFLQEMLIVDHGGGRQQKGWDRQQKGWDRRMPGHHAARALLMAQINAFLETSLHSSAQLCVPCSLLSKTEILLGFAVWNPPFRSYVKCWHCCFDVERS